MEYFEYVLIEPEDQEEMEMDISRCQGGWRLQYRDHHTVSQTRFYETRQEAAFAAFRWKLLRGMFLPEMFGGCALEVSDRFKAKVQFYPYDPGFAP